MAKLLVGSIRNEPREGGHARLRNREMFRQLLPMTARTALDEKVCHHVRTGWSWSHSRRRGWDAAVGVGQGKAPLPSPSRARARKADWLTPPCACTTHTSVSCCSTPGGRLRTLLLETALHATHSGVHWRLVKTVLKTGSTDLVAIYCSPNYGYCSFNLYE
jgi:hypothetical protein